jgi:fucose permease
VTRPGFSPAVYVLYGAALLQGLALVSFPASSAILEATQGFSSTQYGSLFLPQVACAILASVLGGILATRLGLQALLRFAHLGNTLSQVFLVTSLWVPHPWAYTWCLLGTSFLGLGFGMSGAPLNTYAALFFPQRQQSAVGLIHTLMGVGFAVGPAIVGYLSTHHLWAGYATGLAVLLLVNMVLTGMMTWPAGEQPMATQDAAGTASMSQHPAKTTVFWLFALIAVIYSLAEGTFGNWAVLYLGGEQHLPMTVAAWGLSAFWAGVAGGRLVVSILVGFIPAALMWALLPVLMLLTFLALPQANTALLGIGLFALGGIACSGVFPLTVSLASRAFPHHVAFVSAMMMAALMTGVGIGSFTIGALHQFSSLATLFQYAAAYPAVVLILMGCLHACQKKPAIVHEGG